ncbi:MAG TPA: FkbM family methyltransferase [Kofleriaceae bacterium]
MADAASSFKAQFGEDKLLAQHFADKPAGYFVEIGAYDGVRMSNTFYFEQIGWHGLLVEADPDLAQRCREARPHSAVVQCAVVAPDAPKTVTFQVSEDWKSLSSLSFDRARKEQLERLSGGFRVSSIAVPGKTLDEILDDNAVATIDFLTIDVEGHEWDVLRGFSIDRWRPEIVIVERNTLLPDLRIARYMFEHGYRYIRTTGVNDWFGRAQRDVASRVRDVSHFATTFYVVHPAQVGVRRARKRLKAAARATLARVGLLETVKRFRR